MRNILIVTKFTFLEVYRSRLMISLVFLALSLVVITFVASEFTYGASAKISLDIGLGIMSISNLIIAIFIGATLLSKEIEQKTLYMILSRPISRGSFLTGKILGLSSVLLLNSIVLGLVSFFLFVKNGGVIENLFWWTLYFSFLEAFTVLIFAVFFSLLTNTTLSVVYTIGIFIVGHALNETARTFLLRVSELLKIVLNICFFIVPNFYRLNLKDFLIYQQDISWNYILATQLYIYLYLIALLALVVLIFKNKNLD
ncbi:MAG: ABC transporter permease subunit [Bacteriovorax sp.]|nr:ABC transporter permease subunit [Bacteriovorax sp.]